MTIELQVGWRQLAVGVAVLVGAVGLMVWWSSPARSQGASPPVVDTFAFVARADNPVDALAASSAAGQLGAPVYLTFPDGLDEQAAEGLEATDPQVVVLAGGTAALSEAVEQQIGDLLPDATIRRFAGIGRTETAKLINELTGQLGVNRPVVAGATVAGDVGIDGTLTVASTDVGAALQELSARIDTLQGDLSAANGRIDTLEGDLSAANGRIDTLEGDLTVANGRIDDLESTLAGVSRSGDTLTFSAMNVAIVNGQGATATTNGLGNLIVGYNEDHTDSACYPSSSDCQYGGDGAADTRSGSHNLIVGVDHTYTSYAGHVAGNDNTISGVFASVSGGDGNTASGNWASVSGGHNNTASDLFASVSGGTDNIASGRYASVSGGSGNTASGERASVSGGSGNTASGDQASVSGGGENTAFGSVSSVSGGSGNIASGLWSSVSGGGANIASGQQSSVSGGFQNEGSGLYASVSGGRDNMAADSYTSVAGGRDGTIADAAGNEYDSLIGNSVFADS